VTVKAPIEDPGIGLGDGPGGVVEFIRSTRMLPNNFWEQRSGSTVAQVGGEHTG